MSSVDVGTSSVLETRKYAKSGNRRLLHAAIWTTRTFPYQFSTTKYTASSWQLRKFNTLVACHFSITRQTSIHFSLLLLLSRYNLITRPWYKVYRTWNDVEYWRRRRFYAIKGIGRRQFLKSANSIVRFKSLIIRLIHRRLWFQVQRKENQS